jgi:hypothetical protein
MPGKRVTIDDETWTVLDLLARDRMATFQELADEAFADLLKKHGRPVGLKAALRQSAGVSAEGGPAEGPHKTARKTGQAGGQKSREETEAIGPRGRRGGPRFALGKPRQMP